MASKKHLEMLKEVKTYTGREMKLLDSAQLAHEVEIIIYESETDMAELGSPELGILREVKWKIEVAEGNAGAGGTVKSEFVKKG